MKISKKLLFTLNLAIILNNSPAEAFYFIFDFPATLVSIDKRVFFTDVIGYFSGAKIILGGNLSGLLNLENTTFKVLEKLGKQECAPELVAQTPEGRILPQIFCDWLTDTLSPNAAAKKATRYVEKTLKKGTERDVIERITQAIFDTKQLSRHWAIIGGGLQLVTDCAQRYGKDHLYIVANWNTDSMLDLFSKAKHMHPLMKQFQWDHFYISGFTKLLLPNPDCFEKLLKEEKLNPNQCIFISGIERHVNAARKFGMRAILIPDGNYNKVREELHMLGIL